MEKELRKEWIRSGAWLRVPFHQWADDYMMGETA